MSSMSSSEFMLSSSPSSEEARKSRHGPSSVGCAVIEAIQKFEEHTNLTTRTIAALGCHELRVGKLLGQGTFNNVREVVVTRHGFHDRYAIKHPRHKVLKDFTAFKSCATDLMYEAKLLASLSHKNVIGIRAISNEKACRDEETFFVVLDRIEETLHTRMERWRNGGQCQTPLASMVRASKRAKLLAAEKESGMRRMKQVALPLAQVMGYLHCKRIVYRDLKPDNVGFDACGVLKLLDFGLAREIVDPQRRMTQKTGSRRFMAPEVAQGRHYGLAVDRYSFGVLLWELVTLQNAFESMTQEDHKHYVVERGIRPRMPKGSWFGADPARLIKRMWDDQPAHRPPFAEAVRVVRRMLREYRTEVDALQTNNQTTEPTEPTRTSARAA